MARKDVDLVIRAKDEAAKVVDSITTAINEFIEAQNGLNKSAGKTNSTLGALGTALGELDRSLRGVAVSDKLASELDKATAAAQRLNAEFEETKQEAARLAASLAEAEANTKRLKAATDEAAAAQARQAAALDRQKQKQAELTKSLKDAAAERDKLLRQEKSIATQGQKQDERVAAATERYNRLAAQIEATAKPTKTLQARFESASNTLDKQNAKLRDLENRFLATKDGIEKAQGAIERYTRELAESNAEVQKQEGALKQASDSYKELQTAAKAAAGHQKEIANAADKTADALERQSARVEKSRAELTELSAAAGKADAAMAELAGQSGRAMQSALGAFRASMRQTRDDFKAVSAGANELAAAMDIIGPPTRQQVVELGRLRVAADAAEKSLEAQAGGLRQMRAILEESGGGVEELRARQERFAAAQREVAAALDKIQAEARESAQAFDRLAVSTDRTGGSMHRVGTAARSTATNTQQAAQSTNALSEAYRRLYGESRQAMSWTQRLRGEVLSLIAAYGGLYGVIDVLRQTVNAYQTLEAAQSRLNAAFKGNQEDVGRELDFIRRNADRLGIEFGSLADQYSKFAVATQGTSLEGEKTRKIFISVAEAARVNKLSFDELRGVFNALSQIVSKGSVQMEELKQQLGDRLPGALQIMADGLKIGTDELIKMMEQGGITAEALVPFAEELDRRFGPGLAAALETTTTALGQFRNAAFQALVQFGQAGFIESFTNLLRDLTETMKSADFQAFSARVSQAFGVLVDAIALAARNFDLLVMAASAFVGIKLTPLIVALGSNLATFAGNVQRVGTIMRATRNTMLTATAATTGFTTATTLAATAVRGLTLAIRTLVSSTGIGLIVTAISVGIGWWATRADEATEALNEHQKIVDRVRNEYDEAGGAVKNWAEELKAVTALQAEAHLNRMIEAAREAREALNGLSAGTGVAHLSGDARKQAEAIRDLSKAFIETGGDVDEFKSKIAAIGDAALDEAVKEYAVKVLDAADDLKTFEQAVSEARDVLIAKTGTAEEAEAAMKRLNGALGDAGDGAAEAAKKSEAFNEALGKIRDILPEINQGLDDLKTKAQIDEAFQSAAKAAEYMWQLNLAVDEANDAYSRMYQNIADKNFGRFTSGVDAAAALIRDREKFVPDAYWDVNHFRVGFGSDTVTDRDGSWKMVAQGMRVSIEEANRDLIRRLGEVFRALENVIGKDTFDKLTPQQQAALASVTYNYGAGELRPGGDLSGIIEAVRSGTTKGVADAIRARGGDNGGVNRNRRGIEAALYESTAGVETMAEQQQRDAQRAEEERQRQREHTQETIAGQQAEIANQELINAGKAREAEIEKALAEAKKADPNITADEIAKIREQTGALFDLKQVREQDNSQKKEAEALMQRINALLQQRTALEKQLKAEQQAGNTEGVQQTEAAIQGVNTALDEAIAKARAMWESIGGAAADTALIKLDTAALKARTMAQQAQQNLVDWGRVGQLFASGLTNAFDQFAQAVANGEDVGDAARKAFLQFAADFLRQIAQMIIQQAILNALRSFGFPGLGAVGVGHTGGVVGSSRIGSGNSTRRVDAGMFANAIRLHSGGIPGLRPGEVPAILKKREEVLTEDDPRHALNGGLTAAAGAAGSSGDVHLRNVNVFNAEDMLEQALRRRVGEQVFLNFVRDNPEAIRNALEGG